MKRLSSPPRPASPREPAAGLAALAALVLAGSICAPSASAQAPPAGSTTGAAPGATARAGRVVVLVDELLDGAPRGARVAEAALQGTLAQAGVTLIDAAQSRKIRSVTDAGTLMEGQVPEVITALDADVIVAGKLRLQRVQNDLLGPRVHSADAALTLKVIAVDDGQVLALLSGQAQAVGFTDQQAGDKAGRQAVATVRDALLAGLRAAAGPARLELTVTGIPNVTASERVVAGLKAVAGVGAATVLQAGRGRTKIELKVQGTSARAVATALDGTSGLGLSVIGYSRRAITAEYSPAHALQLNMVLTPFRAARGSAPAGWRAGALAGVLGVATSNLAFIRLFRDGSPVALRGEAPKRWARELKRLGLEPSRTILARGTVARRSAQGFEVNASLVAASTGAVLVADRRACPAATLGDCVGTLADELSGKLLPAVLAKRAAFRDAVPQRLASAPPAAPRALSVEGLTLSPIFPARLPTYSDHPVGTLTLRNTSRAPVRDVVVSVAVDGFTRQPLDVPVGTIKPGAQRVVPLKLVLSRQALLSHDTNSPAVLSASARYVIGHGSDALEGQLRRSKAILVYGRNVVSWAEPQSVASFVTAKTPRVQALASALNASKPAAAGVATAPPPAATTAAAILTGMGAAGIRYKADPASPFGSQALDYAQFPEQTVDKRAGDCDDLAILFAALAEGAGQRTLLMVTPDHIFAAVDTGLPPRARDALSLTPGRTFAHDGSLWIPVETTLVGHPFQEAWAAGAREVARWEAKPEALRRVDLRAAWARFPAQSLVASRRAVAATPDAAALRASMEAWAKGYAARRASALDAAITKLRGATSLADRLHLSHLLVLRGELDAAREALSGLDDPRALNALGNIAQLTAHPKAALGDYDKALAHKADARIHLNAAIAAHALGDDDTFADHIFACVELGAEDAVVRLARAGVSAGARGADAASGAGARAMGDVGAAIRAAYTRRGRALPAAAKRRDEARASNAGAGRPDVAPFLFWL